MDGHPIVLLPLEEGIYGAKVNILVQALEHLPRLESG
jgi:hypothetical protein